MATTPALPLAAPAVYAPRGFEVRSIEKTPAPDGATGTDWYRYVLSSGNNNSTITGQRRGSLEDVRSYAALCAEQLNVRALTAASPWSLRGRKPGVAPKPPVPPPAARED